MSVRVMAAVFAARIGDAPSKAVLLAMADYAADDGSSIHPSVETLTEKTELSRRTVQRALADLKKQGLIHEVSRRADAACHYRIDLWEVEVRRYPERPKKRSRRSASATPLSNRRSVSVTPPREQVGASERRTRGCQRDALDAEGAPA
jgi:pyocin large subunit-like protein